MHSSEQTKQNVESLPIGGYSSQSCDTNNNIFLQRNVRVLQRKVFCDLMNRESVHKKVDGKFAILQRITPHIFIYLVTH